MAPKSPLQLEEVVRKRVRVLRAERGLTQEQLCERAGVSIDAVSRIEGGSRVPTLDTVERLARALAVSPSALLEGPDPAARVVAPKAASIVRRIASVLEQQPDEVQRLAERAVGCVVRAFAAGRPHARRKVGRA